MYIRNLGSALLYHYFRAFLQHLASAKKLRKHGAILMHSYMHIPILESHFYTAISLHFCSTLLQQEYYSSLVQFLFMLASLLPIPKIVIVKLHF